MAAASAAAVSRLSCSHQIHHHLIARDVKEKKGQPEHQQSCNQPTNQHFPSGAYLAVLPHAQSSLFLSNKIPNRGERQKSRLIKSNRPGNSAADGCDGCGTQQIRQSMIRRVSARIWRRKKQQSFTNFSMQFSSLPAGRPAPRAEAWAPSMLLLLLTAPYTLSRSLSHAN